MKIFDTQVSRKPDRYPWAQDFIKAIWFNPWNPEEFKFQSDLHNFKADLTDQERIMVMNTLSAIGQIEIAVKTFWAKLGVHLPHPSLTDLGFTMAHTEVIHNKAYERLLDTLQLQHVFEENLKLDIIKGRVNYLRKYLDKNYEDAKKQYVYSLILFTLFVENVSLFSQFYIILWLNRYRNVLKDTAQQVQYTKNEELLHALAGIKIIQTIRSEYPRLFDDELTERVQHEAKEAFKAESKIIDWMVADYTGENLSASILKEYVKGRINESLGQIGFGPAFELDKTLLSHTKWMNEEVLGNGMTDFFHQRPVEYTKEHKGLSADDLF
jgi:ribonucleoside-diphosphate reductase beta chain